MSFIIDHLPFVIEFGKVLPRQMANDKFPGVAFSRFGSNRRKYASVLMKSITKASIDSMKRGHPKTRAVGNTGWKPERGWQLPPKARSLQSEASQVHRWVANRGTAFSFPGGLLPLCLVGRMIHLGCLRRLCLTVPHFFR